MATLPSITPLLAMVSVEMSVMEIASPSPPMDQAFINTSWSLAKVSPVIAVVHRNGAFAAGGSGAQLVIVPPPMVTALASSPSGVAVRFHRSVIRQHDQAVDIDAVTIADIVGMTEKNAAAIDDGRGLRRSRVSTLMPELASPTRLPPKSLVTVIALSNGDVPRPGGFDQAASMIVHQHRFTIARKVDAALITGVAGGDTWLEDAHRNHPSPCQHRRGSRRHRPPASTGWTH